MDSSSASQPNRPLPLAALVCLAGAFACSAAILLLFQSHLTFVVDDWEFLIDRRGSSAAVYLDPHNEHIAVAPVAIYKALLALFGMSSAFPFAVVGTFIFLLSVVLLFVYLRRRVGYWMALLGSVLILFLGAAWSDLLWSFQMGFSGSVAAGIGALLALERDDLKGDLAACALLVVAISFSELGVPFALGALVSVALGPSEGGWRPQAVLRRLYVALLPLALYGIWYLGWGHKAPHTMTFHNVLNSPRFVFDAVSANLASLFGLTTPLSGNVGPNNIGLNWGRILVVIAIVLAIWRLRRMGWPSRWLWVVVAAGAAFWFLTAFNAIPYKREPVTGRYQYPGAIFVLLIAAEFLRGVRFDRRALAAATVVTVAAAVSGYFSLHDGYRLRKFITDMDRGTLTGAEIARGHMNSFSVIQLVTSTPPIPASSYFSAVDAFGSPAFIVSELAASDEVARAAADKLLAEAEDVKLAPHAGQGPRAGSPCRSQPGWSHPGSRALALRPGDYTVRTQKAQTIYAARFADDASATLGDLAPGAVGALRVPADLSKRPWRLETSGAVTLCKVGGS
ncbi:MAG: hypothetical protein AABM43_00845 [Actinomycetota bacterium]